MITLAAMYKDVPLTQYELLCLLDLDPNNMTLDNSFKIPPRWSTSSMILLAAMFKDLSLTQGELRFLLDLDPYNMTLDNSLTFPQGGAPQV